MVDQVRRQRKAKQRGANASHFPIFSYEDYDFGFLMGPWQVGLKSTHPEELIRRAAAALVSLQMGNAGIDYTYKRYLKGKRYDVNDGNRVDLRIARTVSRRSELLGDLIYRVTETEDKRQGEILCEWTFMRVPFSTKLLLTCASRGAFFESISIARMILEQIAWAVQVDGLEDTEQIQRTSATRAVGRLNKVCPVAGRLYGWLSTHAHWAYDGHVKAMSFEDGQLAALFATSEFKARALALSLLLCLVAETSFVATKQEAVRAVLQTKSEPSSLDWTVYDPLEKELSIVAGVDQLGELLDTRSILSLGEELIQLLPEDRDIQVLTEMVATAAATALEKWH